MFWDADGFASSCDQTKEDLCEIDYTMQDMFYNIFHGNHCYHFGYKGMLVCVRLSILCSRPDGTMMDAKAQLT